MEALPPRFTECSDKPGYRNLSDNGPVRHGINWLLPIYINGPEMHKQCHGNRNLPRVHITGRAARPQRLASSRHARESSPLWSASPPALPSTAAVLTS